LPKRPKPSGIETKKVFARTGSEASRASGNRQTPFQLYAENHFINPIFPVLSEQPSAFSKSGGGDFRAGSL
jgi:hypothetical protein